MKKIVLTFGLIAFAVVAAVMAVTLPLTLNGQMDGSFSELIGYTTMVVAFLAVFFGIRRYRESIGGWITFGKAFQVGILITLVACVMYVVVWEIVYFNFLPDFGDKYAALTINKMRADGATPAEIEEKTRQMAQFMEWYKNPLINVAMTFMEIFPVGLIMTLVSAAILRRKTPRDGQPVAANGLAG
jgi:multidrug efflux pump subunit AcrB